MSYPKTCFNNIITVDHFVLEPCVFVVLPVGRQYVEDGLPAAGAGGFGASLGGTPDSAGVGHHPNGDGGAGCPIGS